MGADIKILRSRIKSIDSTLHLTKAMGLVAASKIRRATEAMNRSNEYEKAVSDVMDKLIVCPEAVKSPYLEKRESDKICLLVVAGDRGLAGGYNVNIFNTVREYDSPVIIPIGKRACERYGRGYSLAEKFSTDDAVSLAKDVCRRFSEGEFDRAGIVCTKYISIMSQEAQVKWILPLEKKQTDKQSGILFEPDEITILNTAVSEYIAAMIVAAVRESFASEVAARRFAMDSAGKNAQEMMSDLQIKYNRARQGEITQEITEIVAGSNS